MVGPTGRVISSNSGNCNTRREKKCVPFFHIVIFDSVFLSMCVCNVNVDTIHGYVLVWRTTQLQSDHHQQHHPWREQRNESFGGVSTCCTRFRFKSTLKHCLEYEIFSLLRSCLLLLIVCRSRFVINVWLFACHSRAALLCLASIAIANQYAILSIYFML